MLLAGKAGIPEVKTKAARVRKMRTMTKARDRHAIAAGQTVVALPVRAAIIAKTSQTKSGE